VKKTGKGPTEPKTGAKNGGNAIAAIRVRGTKGVRKTVSRTLELLGLTRKNHCIILRPGPVVKGMLEKARDYVAWGEVGEETLGELLEKKARVAGNRKPSPQQWQGTGFGDAKELAKAVCEGRIELRSVPGMKKVFRLEPPAKGLGPVKVGYPRVATGYWGKEINGAIKKMIR